MELTKEQGNQLIWGELDGWEQVDGSEEIIEQQRWMTLMEAVFEHIESNKFYRTHWQSGNTENQECDPFEYDAPDMTEVELKEVTVSKWMKVKENA